MNHNLNFIEVLSPAGSFESLEAAVKAGADAIYVGGHKFGARAYAGNFDREEMLRAIDYTHLHGKQIYMTINTLFKSEEVDALYDYLLPYYKEGLDAVIVQDVGVANLMKKQFPGLDLHASTQMAVMGAEGAKFLEELGFTRVVPARELALEEIADIRKTTNLEIETFVHGALCFSYSGQCLMSSMLGGRSGNRGRCAQPCRLPYDLYQNGQKKNKKEERYLLSPKDLCSIEILPKILEAGTNSLKIEGRMKRPEYVAAVTRQYRQYVDLYLEQKDRYHVRQQDMQELMELYNRGGFTKGYYLTHNGRDMMSMKRPNHMGYPIGKIKEIRKNQILFSCQADLHKKDILEISIGKDSKVELTSPIDVKKGSLAALNANQIRKLRPGMEILRTRNQYLIDELNHNVIGIEKKENLKGNVTFSVGKPVMMQIYYKNLSIMVTGDEVLEAKNQPISAQKLKEQLTKTGGTPFYLEITELTMEGNGFLPVGSIKALRRDALEQMERAIIGQKKREHIDKILLQKSQAVSSNRHQIIASVTTIQQAKVAMVHDSVDALYVLGEMVPFEQWESFSQKVHENGKELYYMMPYVFSKKAKDEWKEQEKLICQGSHDGILVKTMDEFALIRSFSDYHKPMILDSSLYAYHDLAADFYREYAGCPVRMILPVELNVQELSKLQIPDADMVVYGHQPLMISAQCQTKNHLGCTKKMEVLSLKDRYQKDFPVQNFCRYCYNVIYNGEPLQLINEEKLLRQDLGGKIYRFTIESPKKVTAVLDHQWKKTKYTKGHFKRGIE
jgi:putative protease